MDTAEPRERAVLVGATIKGERTLWSLEESLKELAQLTDTAGAEVVAVVSQHVERSLPTYVGTGKLNDIKRIKGETGATLVIFDDELKPAQQRTLEEALGEKVIDRTALILHIFARHARTREGQLQVELAQHEYLLPRLRGQWSHLERLGGGIGTLGPGETQLETDRRLIRLRIQKLKRELEEVREHRAQYRARRMRRGLGVASLVGYTNAGKSTLLNALTRAGVRAEDRLFATLDPVTRRIDLPSGRPLLLTDTVGFIHKLPPTLVAAFRATLEELSEANILLHVTDITHPRAAEQAQVVDETLADLGLKAKPRLMVLNKIDRFAPREEPALAVLHERTGVADGTWNGHPAVAISAERRWGLDRLRETIDQLLGDLERQEREAEALRNVPAAAREFVDITGGRDVDDGGREDFE